MFCVQAAIYSTEDAEGKQVSGRYVVRQGTAAAPSGGFQKQHMLGTMQYMAPEGLMRRGPSYPADVYAYAIFGTFILIPVRAISMTS